MMKHPFESAFTAMAEQQDECLWNRFHLIQCKIYTPYFAVSTLFWKRSHISQNYNISACKRAFYP